MQYFTWMLGVSFAAPFAIINTIRLKSVCDIDSHGIDQSPESLAHRSQESML